MTPSWPYGAVPQLGDLLTTTIKSTSAFERWAYCWLPPLRPLLRRQRDRREPVPVMAVVTAIETSSGGPALEPIHTSLKSIQAVLDADREFRRAMKEGTRP